MSISNSLFLKIAADKSVVELGKMLTPLKEFATSFNGDAEKKGSEIVVPLFAGGEAAQFDASSNNYCADNGSVNGVSVPLSSHLVSQFATTDVDLTNVDIRFWEGAGQKIARELGRGIATTTMGLVNKTNVSAEYVFPELSAQSKAATAALYAAADSAGVDPYNAVVVVKPTVFANLLANLEYNVYGGTEAFRDGYIPGLFGFKAVIASNAFTTLSAEKLNGAIIGADSIALASRYVKPMDGVYEITDKATDEATGATIGFRGFGNKCDGSIHLAGEVLFGAKLLQPNQVVRLVEEATA